MIPTLQALGPEDLLKWAVETYGNSFAISTSFQSEGMVLVDMASRISPRVRVLTLDTGRLPEETYAMIDVVRSRYGVQVEIVCPDPTEVEAMVLRHGPNLFRNSVPLRMLCCQIRKVRPLERKLNDIRAYAVGLRREQTELRQNLETVTEEPGGRLKLSPLAGWSRQQVEAYIRRHDVPRHPLYAKGYTSIGCAPCTRPVATGEGERSGRWWWESGTAKECGLHFSADGRVECQVDVLLREVICSAHA